MLKRLACVVALSSILPAAWAIQEGQTQDGHPYVSGGVTRDELASIGGQKSAYALSILTAAQGTGAYLADVHVAIRDQHGQQVLDTTMDGPYLMVDLAPGTYQIEASDGSSTKRSSVSIRNGEHRQTAFYFDTHDEVEQPTAASAEASDWADQQGGGVMQNTQVEQQTEQQPSN
jgi:hypothetical protein